MSALDEKNRLKQDESRLLSNIQAWKQKCNELEKRCQEEAQGITKERIASKCGELKIALNKIMKTLNEDVSIFMYVHRAVHVKTYM